MLLFVNIYSHNTLVVSFDHFFIYFNNIYEDKKSNISLHYLFLIIYIFVNPHAHHDGHVDLVHKMLDIRLAK